VDSGWRNIGLEIQQPHHLGHAVPV
jgi:hypothetical protein